MLAADYSDIIRKIICSILVGLVIRILDDYIDQDIQYVGKSNYIIEKFEKSIFPYSILFVTIAAGIHLQYTITLISSCYIVGMFHDLHMKLPTGLNGYSESIILVIINIFLFSFKDIVTSLMIIILIQCIDDLLDMTWDRKYGYKNYANKFGKLEIVMISLIITILLIMFDSIKLVIVFSCALLVNYIIEKEVPKFEIK
ncbi:hypothetical protein QBE52_09790 [Clostridiaceae bacterium 35-E11]